MSITTTLGILAGRSVKLAAKILHRGGTAKPGEIALKLCPNLVEQLARDMHIIVITGTNGKTTTARIVEQGLTDAGISCTANRSGANLLSGIATMLMENCSLSGKPRSKVAVVECDEAAFRKAVPQLQPEVILVTNLFRDQLDRYGSMENVLGYIREGIQGAPKAKVCLNADCSLVASLGDDVENECFYYGMDEHMGGGAEPEVSAAPNCIRCGTPYEYDYRIYGHLGGFKCPQCGYKRPDSALTVTELVGRDADSSTVKVLHDGKTYTMRVNLPADYNIYNALGAVSALTAYGVSLDSALGSCESFSCGFGRMEKLESDKATYRMVLVKNAVGCDQVISYMCSLDEDFLPVFLLNNKPADGTDISWIEEASFERLAEKHGHEAMVAGMCAHELAERLIQAGFSADGVVVEQDLDRLVERMEARGGNVFVVPNYTSMLDIHHKLAQKCGSKEFWEE